MFEELSIYQWYLSVGIGSVILFTTVALLWIISCAIWGFLDDKENGYTEKKWWFSEIVSTALKQHVAYSMGLITQDEYSTTSEREYNKNPKYTKLNKGTGFVESVLAVIASAFFIVAIVSLATWILINIILPNLAAALIIGSIPVAMVSARFVRRLSKKFELHIKDNNAHCETVASDGGTKHD